ncbi:class I SAM-dependent methyltransferase [Deinococcus sp. UR1]|uniref:class I SAM-dependent methyltransferase n=1 Tax=Deinococcus sp. UR1 TaxID=1704277 RepID=UPI0013046AD6|nr:class I SAM-dependent methyltransferase [Deinococcus sp. UR1]
MTDARRDALIAALYGPVGWPRARWVVGRLRPHLPTACTLLDLGAGTGHTGALLARQGWAVTLADVPPHPGAFGQRLIAHPCARTLARRGGLTRVLFQGRLPFPDGQFGVTLLAFVLHHCPDPLAVLREAARVSGRVIVIEDLEAGGRRPGRAGQWLDALLNLEAGHPHAHRSQADWHALFRAAGLQVQAQEHWTTRPLGVRTGHTLFDLRPAGGSRAEVSWAAESPPGEAGRGS